MSIVIWTDAVVGFLYVLSQHSSEGIPRNRSGYESVSKFPD